MRCGISAVCKISACLCVCFQYVCLQLRSVFDIVCHRHQVVQLDASTDSKFSQHLVFRLDNAVFRDNINAGRGK